MTPDLPDGWTIERVRSLSGDDTAVLISADRPVALWKGHQQDHAPLRAATVLALSGLCLVKEEHTNDWYMGHIESDGSVVCWGCYGDNLQEAIRGL